MVKSFEKNEVINEKIKVNIIPELKRFKELSLAPGDTLVAFVDHEKWNMEEAQQFYRLLEKAFPYNSICIMFDGVELGVVKNGK